MSHQKPLIFDDHDLVFVSRWCSDQCAYLRFKPTRHAALISSLTVWPKILSFSMIMILPFFLGGVQLEGDQCAHLWVQPARHAAHISSLSHFLCYDLALFSLKDISACISEFSLRGMLRIIFTSLISNIMIWPFFSRWCSAWRVSVRVSLSSACAACCASFSNPSYPTFRSLAVFRWVDPFFYVL